MYREKVLVVWTEDQTSHTFPEAKAQSEALTLRSREGREARTLQKESWKRAEGSVHEVSGQSHLRNVKGEAKQYVLVQERQQVTQKIELKSLTKVAALDDRFRGRRSSLMREEDASWDFPQPGGEVSTRLPKRQRPGRLSLGASAAGDFKPKPARVSDPKIPGPRGSRSAQAPHPWDDEGRMAAHLFAPAGPTAQKNRFLTKHGCLSTRRPAGPPRALRSRTRGEMFSRLRTQHPSCSPSAKEKLRLSGLSV